MTLTNEEQQLIKESLGVYLQLASQQMPPATIEAMADKIRDLLEKLPLLGQSNGDGPANKPANITDEWFSNVCITCEKLSPTGCTDNVTKKFPGKCDPILKYEMQKRLDS